MLYFISSVVFRMIMDKPICWHVWCSLHHLRRRREQRDTDHRPKEAVVTALLNPLFVLVNYSQAHQSLSSLNPVNIFLFTSIGQINATIGWIGVWLTRCFKKKKLFFWGFRYRLFIRIMNLSILLAVVVSTFSKEIYASEYFQLYIYLFIERLEM